MLSDLTREQIAKVLRRHRGSQVEVARRAGVDRVSVAVWLTRGTSANIEQHAREVARELLAEEALENSISIRASKKTTPGR